MATAQIVAERIRAFRLAKGLSREVVASAAGCSERALASYEAGERSPQLDTLGAIAAALGVPCGALLGDETPTADEAVSLAASQEGVHAVLVALARFVENSGSG